MHKHRYQSQKAIAPAQGRRSPLGAGAGGKRGAWGVFRARFELLEDRLALSAGSPLATDVSIASTLSTAINSSSASPTGVGFSPAQIRAAYGFGSLSTDAAGNALVGTGQTIAIVDAYNDPNIVGDVDHFDQQLGATTAGPSLFQQYGAASSFLTVLNQNGSPGSLPGTDPAGPNNSKGTWEQEESLDVEWAHAIAPGAQIILIETNSATWSDLSAGVLTASNLPGVTVVSMSWGISESGSISAAQQHQFDQALSGFTGISYVAATGDSGGAGLYPSTSPSVLAVGGTALKLNSDGSYNTETAWSGSDGGFSQIESKPTYQDGVLSSNELQRSVPDVAFDGSTLTAVVTYDTYDNPLNAPWSAEGGTSLGTPVWAGLIALANQGRQAAGSAVLGSASSDEALSAIYSLPQRDFHDITAGSNKSFSAESGFDQVTGLGTPIVNFLVPDLVNYGGAITLTPSTVATGTVGSPYSQSITASGGTGAKSVSYNITAGSLPSGLNISVSGSELDIIGTPTAAGSVAIDVTATDNHGDSLTLSYEIDVKSLLNVSIDQSPAAISNQSSASFAFSSSGDTSTPANQVVYQTSLDGAPFTAANSPINYSNLADGSHTFQVEAVDLNNQVSAPASFTWLIDTVAPTSQVAALPDRTSSVNVPVSWSGSDSAGGSGIQSYSIYVSEDGGPFQVWLSATTQTTMNWVGQIGHTYGFYSVATDKAGNVEPAHLAADTSIVIAPAPWQNPVNPLDVDGDGTVAPNDALDVINALNSLGSGPLPATNAAGAPYLDVDGDDNLSPNDALEIINFLNSQAAGGSGGNAARASAQQLAAPASDLPADSLPAAPLPAATPATVSPAVGQTVLGSLPAGVDNNRSLAGLALPTDPFRTPAASIAAAAASTSDVVDARASSNQAAAQGANQAASSRLLSAFAEQHARTSNMAASRALTGGAVDSALSDPDNWWA